MEEPGSGDAEAQGVWVERQPRVHQEDQVQQQQSQAQLDQDFGWSVLPQLPAVFKWIAQDKESQRTYLNKRFP